MATTYTAVPQCSEPAWQNQPVCRKPTIAQRGGTNPPGSPSPSPKPKEWKKTGVTYQTLAAQLPASGTITARYHTSDGDTSAAETGVAPLELDLTPGAAQRVFEGSVRFKLGTDQYYDRDGYIYRDLDPVTGAGVQAGTIDYGTGKVTLDNVGAGNASGDIIGMLTSTHIQPVSEIEFRCPGAPIRPGSLSIICQDTEGNNLPATANFSGAIDSGVIQGVVNYQTGIVSLIFGEEVTAAGNEAEDWYDADAVVEGKIWRPLMVWADTVKFNCVVYSYLPLDADIIGLDPVRLPADGKVPIFRPGDIVMVHNSQSENLPNNLVADQEITLSRQPISAVDLYDQNDVYVPETHYSVNLTTGVITMANPLDLSGFSQPLVAVTRIEDAIMANDVQISGHLSLIRGIEHDYAVENTFVSTVLPFGDVKARVFNVFDQDTWTDVWSDTIIGDPTTANFDLVNYPITVTNKGAIDQRWAVIFDSATHFNIAGEDVGIIASGYTNETMAPENPATETPYFTIPNGGWGSGWAAGNVVRFNTVAANKNIWIVRTTLPGPQIEPTDNLTLQIRGDAD